MKIPALLLTLASACALAAAAPAHEFFAFDNGVGRGTWSPERQASTLKALGYDGISYNYTNPGDLAVWVRTFRAHGLKIHGLYVHTFVDGPAAPFDPRLGEAIALLKDTGCVVWITVREPKKKGDHDAAAVRNIGTVADLARAQGLRVGVYPHRGYYVSNAEDALRLVKLADRPNTGVLLNLCHEFSAGRGGSLDKTIAALGDRLLHVTINGTDTAKPTEILRLDQGNFDLAAFLGRVAAAGYRGPVGLQLWSVKGDCDENLRVSMETWRRLTPRP